MRAPLAASVLVLLALCGWLAIASAGEELDPGDLPARLATASHDPARLAVARGALASSVDTTYVGFVPGKVSATNWWGLGTGSFKPYSTSAASYGYWGWDDDAVHANVAEVHGDSLFGWWPVRNVTTGTGGLVMSDESRPWWAIDHGNQANYVINQGPGHRRTFGVVGIWHRDDGAASGGGVTWSALGGTHSLWCGLRRDGDNAFVDPITGNAFNARLLAANAVATTAPTGGIGTSQKFPGYGSQWDQMAYRDLDVGGASTVTLRFQYRSNMSTGKTTSASTRTGWFDKDPLAVTSFGAAAGNFISSTTAGDANAPVDSFMVYVGAPVRDQWLGSDTQVHPVGDPQRRWFAEVLQANAGRYREMLSVAGDHAPDTWTSPPVAIDAAWGDTLRVVFRSKTNRGFDDESGSISGSYSSGGAGAVVIDDVEVSLDGGAFSTLGDFESESAIDNDTAVDATAAWKTTGKPPAIYPHVHDVSSLAYDDLCGPVGGALRMCNLAGNVISLGDHDRSEAAGGLIDGTAERNRYDGIFSPTVNLRNGGGTNEIGISAAIANATHEYLIAYDLYTGIFDFFLQGNAWRFAFQAWPARQSDGALCWGAWRAPNFIMFNPDRECLSDREPAVQYGLLQWSAADAEGGAAYPDSMRIYLGKVQQCFRFGITTGCSPTDGAYFDNVSLAMVTGAPSPLSVDLAQWINDAFPVNGLNRNAVLPGSAAFDTTTALVKSGLNIAQATGNSSRYLVPGDTSVVAATGASVRMDLVFRIHPGPGNYVTVGNAASSLRRLPSSTTPVDVGAPTGHNFWEQYLLDNGAKGTPGGHPAGAVNGGKKWSELVWNSARMDTAEINFYPIADRAIGGPVAGRWATMIEESDPKFASLGIAKNRCFLTTATAAVSSANTVCDIGLTDGWPVSAGYVAESGLPLGQTFEYTKILPDGLFTPGTHVQYFVRREDDPIGTGPYYCPDTSIVYPQPGEASEDAHRWQQFGVLPDMWKKAAYGGLGQACMLYIDLDDRRGDERVWVSIADSVGLTRSDKFGAHNGWHAPGDGADLNDPANFVRNKNEQPGTIWDMYGVKGSELMTARVAGIGADYSNHAPSGAITNKWSFQGPSLAMLTAYYKMLVILTGDLDFGLLGPFTDQGANDVKMIQDFLLSGTSGNRRGLYVAGSGFVSAEQGSSLLSSYLDVDLHDPSYSWPSGLLPSCIDLKAQYPIGGPNVVYSIRDRCPTGPDVLMPLGSGVPTSLYSPQGASSTPLVAGVYHDAFPFIGENWNSLVDGWDIQDLRSGYCGGSRGRLLYVANTFSNVFWMCPFCFGPYCYVDVPGAASGDVLTDFTRLRNNPLTAGDAAIDFGITTSDRVQVRIFDVSGRLVRTIADRRFGPGKYSLVWDGADDRGRPVARGVYFTQVRYVERDRTEARRLIVLK